MAGLLGYMLAIVITLGGYLAGLHWLVSPSDPWQANPKLAQSSAQVPKKRVVPKPAEAAAAEAPVAPEPLAPSKPVMEARAEAPPKLASVEPARLGEPVKPEKPAVQEEPVHSERHHASSSQARRDPPAAKPKASPRRRLAERSEGRRLQLMVLRTYEGPDGRRFSRLLPLSSARQTFAFRDFDW